MNTIKPPPAFDPTVTQPRPFIDDFDGLPVPDRSLVDYQKYHANIGMAMARHTVTQQATRGCPYLCAYCHKIWPKTHVTRSAEHIFAEVRALYHIGVRRFVFIDDIFNLDKKNSSRFFRMVIDHGLKVQIFFPNGLRGDVLTPDLIDLMVEAGTVDFDFSLESASPRIQKLVKKYINLERFGKNIEYIVKHHPQVILQVQTMLGFPTETEAEALATLDFIRDIHWIDFPYVHLLKIFPGTDMEKIALENGVSKGAILRSADLGYHQYAETMPFAESFTRYYQARFFNDYFLSKERLRTVLVKQLKLVTEAELVQKYDTFFPSSITSLDDILAAAAMTREDLPPVTPLPDDYMAVPNINEKMAALFPAPQPRPDALKILLLDLSLFFSGQADKVYDVAEVPLGLMALLTYLNREHGDKVHGKIAKARIDFDDYHQLHRLVDDFKPHLVGIRTLGYYKDFFHRTVAMLRLWGIHGAIITGGPYATASYGQLLQDPGLDLAVLGEGEITLSELVTEMLRHNRRLPGPEVLSQIKGIAFIPGKPHIPGVTTREFCLAAGLSAGLRDYCQEYGGDLFTPMCAAMQILLFRCFGQSQIPVHTLDYPVPGGAPFPRTVTGNICDRLSFHDCVAQVAAADLKDYDSQKTTPWGNLFLTLSRDEAAPTRSSPVIAAAMAHIHLEVTVPRGGGAAAGAGQVLCRLHQRTGTPGEAAVIDMDNYYPQLLQEALEKPLAPISTLRVGPGQKVEEEGQSKGDVKVEFNF